MSAVKSVGKRTFIYIKTKARGNSLAVQWLGFGAFPDVAWVRSLVGELRSCKSLGTAQKKEKKKKVLISLIQRVPINQ